jgi:hypothetical protein
MRGQTWSIYSKLYRQRVLIFPMMQYQVSPECTMVEVAAFLSEVIVCMHPMWCYKRGAIALLFQRDALSFMHSPTSGLAYVADGSSHIITSNSKSIYYAEDMSLLLSLANVTSRYPSSSFGRQGCCHSRRCPAPHQSAV